MGISFRKAGGPEKVWSRLDFFFLPITGPDDAIFSDALNHASIIDGIRLCKAKKYRYEHKNMKDLEQKLQEAENYKVKMIVTDGVFSMDGNVAPLPEICALAEK